MTLSRQLAVSSVYIVMMAVRMSKGAAKGVAKGAAKDAAKGAAKGAANNKLTRSPGEASAYVEPAGGEATAVPYRIFSVAIRVCLQNNAIIRSSRQKSFQICIENSKC